MTQPELPARYRVTLQEGNAMRGLLRKRHGSREEIRDRISDASRRLQVSLALPTRPLTIQSGGSVRADRIAGLLRISDNLELEIVPKFLDRRNATWRQDFFFLAVLSKTGRILPAERLQSKPGRRGELATLVAQSMLHTYSGLRHRPVRFYRRSWQDEFELDGDVDAADLLLPTGDGFPQSSLALTRQNWVNETISTAATTLLLEVRDASTRESLREFISDLRSLPTASDLRHRRLPARHASWQTLYDLSVDVVNGFGLNYEKHTMVAPGFILRTWQSWQQLCQVALRFGLRDDRVEDEPALPLGSRARGPLTANPDILITRGGVPFIVDAKYKTQDKKNPSLSNADVYESLAFMRAAGSKRTVLAYPAVASARTPSSSVPGRTTTFDEVNIDDERIVAMTVEIGGIGGEASIGAEPAVTESGFEVFTRNFTHGVVAAMDD